MFSNLLSRFKLFVIAFAKMSFKQVSIILLNAINSMLSKGMYFFAFYAIFLYDPYASYKYNIPMVIMIGVGIGLWALIVSTLKDQKMQFITPFKGAIPRGLYDIRYILLIGAMFYLFNLKYSQAQFYWYIGVIIISLYLARMAEAMKIKLLGKDWFKYESERK